MELGEKPLVRTASAIFRELCYNYRDQLVAGILVAGWDKKHGGTYGHFTQFYIMKFDVKMFEVINTTKLWCIYTGSSAALCQYEIGRFSWL